MYTDRIESSDLSDRIGLDPILEEVLQHAAEGAYLYVWGGAK